MWMLKTLKKDWRKGFGIGLLLSVLYRALFFLNSWHQGLAWFRPGYIIETLNMPYGSIVTPYTRLVVLIEIIVPALLLAIIYCLVLPDNRWF